MQASFISKVAGTADLNHWERLKLLHLHSQQRRRERYLMIFLWKVTEGKVKGYKAEFLECGRRGRLAVLRPYVRSASAQVVRARENSVGVKGCRLFNLLPVDLRDMRGCSVDCFKNNLDKFLATVPDEPTVSGMTRAAVTNSLMDQLAMQVGSSN